MWAAAPSSGSRAAPEIAMWPTTKTSAASDIHSGMSALGRLNVEMSTGTDYWV